MEACDVYTRIWRQTNWLLDEKRVFVGFTSWKIHSQTQNWFYVSNQYFHSKQHVKKPRIDSIINPYLFLSEILLLFVIDDTFFSVSFFPGRTPNNNKLLNMQCRPKKEGRQNVVFPEKTSPAPTSNGPHSAMAYQLNCIVCYFAWYIWSSWSDKAHDFDLIEIFLLISGRNLQKTIYLRL